MPTPRSPIGLRPVAVAARDLAEVAIRAGAGPPAAGAAPVTITGVCLDSRGVQPGDLYVALPGSRTHGARFAGQAAQRGAAAVLTDPAGADLLATSLGMDGDGGLPVLVTAEVRARLGALAGWVYGDPAERLLMLGVTGTNGKTTTVHLMDSLLRATGRTTGLIGTVEVHAGDLRGPSVRTTPEATDLHALLAVMLEQGATACSMEVSSHALALHRVDGVCFDVAGFTNLSQDHLDFHGSLEDYFAAKADLFTPERSRRGVICVDDEWGVRMAATAGVPVQTFATGDTSADWSVAVATGDATGTDVVLTGPGGVRVAGHVPLPGMFNVANAALAVAMLAAAGIDPATAAEALGGAGGVPGRMERVAGPGAAGEPVGIVDYAHTPAAVAAALAALRPVTPGPLVVVLGAGGDRDPDKRPLMGAAAARGADVVVVTDDNPRSEDAARIRSAVLDGARAALGERLVLVLEVADRREAVAEAVRLAWAGDGAPVGTLLVAGKGHEPGQEISGVVLPFDDRAVLAGALAAASGGSTRADRPVPSGGATGSRRPAR